jgi:TorA maturation chaperone TorD
MTKEIKDKQHNILKGYNMLLYFTGSMIMYEPTEECLSDFWTIGILRNLPVSSCNPRFLKAAAQLRGSCENKSICFKMMQEDFNKLFAGTVNPLAPPYESAYQHNNPLLPDRSIEDVKGFYKSYGWESKFKGKIPDDHLGVELLFLTLLIEKYLELDDKTCNTEMRIEIRRFIDQHIMSWIPEWNENIQEHAKTLSYKGIGTLIYSCIEDLYSILIQNNTNVNES